MAMIKILSISLFFVLLSCNSAKNVNDSKQVTVENKSTEKKRRVIENKDMKSLPAKTKSVNK
jgi:hypothetical protein